MLEGYRWIARAALLAGIALWMMSCVVQAHATVSSTPVATAATPAASSWDFQVRVVSGTQTGQVARGNFTVLDANRPPGGTGTAPTESFSFTWEGQTMTQRDLDGPLRVRFEGGAPVELVGTGGPHERRFGFSAGFERGQFGRDEESFIGEGDPYFGYLNTATYVDGAGVVEFGASPPALAVSSGERDDHHCGPDYEGAHCGPTRCCSRFGWCGSPGEDHCGSARGYAGQFDGPGAPQR